MHPTPSFMRSVAALSAPSNAIDSGRGFAITLSPTQIESNAPERSAVLRELQHLGPACDAEEYAALREREAEADSVLPSDSPY